MMLTIFRKLKSANLRRIYTHQICSQSDLKCMTQLRNFLYAECIGCALIVNIFYLSYLSYSVYRSWSGSGSCEPTDRICKRDVGWHLAEQAGWLHEKKLLHARAYEMRGLEHGVVFLPGLSPLISGSVYLNRSLDSSRWPRARGRWGSTWERGAQVVTYSRAAAER